MHKDLEAQKIEPESELNREETSQRPRKAYEPPRIITHSAEKLEEAHRPANACTSFQP